MATITIHGFAPSTYTRTARMAAIEKGVDHALEPVPFGEPAHFALHPFGRMPILTHGGVSVFETLAILSYLDDAFAGDPLIPTDGTARHATLQSVSVALDYAYDELVRHNLGDDAPGADSEKLARVLDWLDNMAGSGAWLAGDGFGAADLFFGPMLDYHRAQGGDADITRRPALADWFDRVTARPSFAETAAG